MRSAVLLLAGIAAALLALLAFGPPTRAATPPTTLMSWYGDGAGEAGGAIACGTGRLKPTAYGVAMRRDLTGARCGQRVLICTTAPNAPRCARPWVVDSGPYVAGRLIDALPQVLDVLGLDPARGVYRVTYSLLPIDDSRDDPKACWFPRWVGRPYWAHCER